MWQIKRLPLYFDLIFCLVLLPAMLFLLPVDRWFVRDSVYVYLMIAWLYAVYFIDRKLITNWLRTDRRKRLLAIGLLLLTLIVTFLIARYQMDLSPHDMRRPRHMSRPPKMLLQQQAVWFLFVVVSMFSIVVGLFSELTRQMMYRKEIESEKNKAELALYKAQINPHFLFNTLNTLYGLILTGSNKTEEAFMQFINLMRYMYSNGSKERIDIETEIEYIEQYIALQKYRIPGHTQVYFSFQNENTVQLEIAPLILITFVENAFKYGVSTQTPSEIYIVAHIEHGELMFTTQNQIFESTQKKKGQGIGIQNCRKRLELLYPSCHSLNIHQDGNSFSVTLTIKLDEK